MDDTILRVDDIQKFYGNKGNLTKAVDHISFSVRKGEFLGIMGSSGSGKTTLLNCISTIDTVTSGHIYVEGKDITTLHGSQLADFRGKKLGFIFQDFNLLDTLTAYENISLALSIAGTKPSEIQKCVPQIAKALNIQEVLNKYPYQMSGGQQQRVAIARAIASEPHLLLMDEPLSNLDAKLRVDMRSELKRLHIETGTTMIYVTHDQVEALTMSTKIAIFKEGVIIQVAPPLELYNNPANLYVADFIGNPSINFADGKAEVGPDGMTITSPLGKMVFPKKDLTDMLPKEKSFDAVLGIRPEQVSINTTRQTPSDIEAHIYTSMPAGSETLVTVKVGGVSLVIKALGITHYNPDQVVYLSIDLNKINVFDKKSTSLIKYSV